MRTEVLEKSADVARTKMLSQSEEFFQNRYGEMRGGMSMRGRVNILVTLTVLIDYLELIT